MPTRPDAGGLRVTEVAGGVRFAVRVQPRSSREGVEGMQGDALRVRVRASPVDGAANAAVVTLLADALGVPRSRVRIVRGAASRTKLVQVEGVTGGTLPLAIRSSG